MGICLLKAEYRVSKNGHNVCVCVFLCYSYFCAQGNSDFGAKHWGSNRFNQGRFADLLAQVKDNKVSVDFL